MNMGKIETALAQTGAKATVRTVKTIDKLLCSKAGKIMLSVPLAMSCLAAVTVSAADDSATTMVTSVFDTIKTWVKIIGSIAIVFGGISFGMAIKNDDEPGRGRALMTIAGGAVVTAIAEFVTIST